MYTNDYKSRLSAGMNNLGAAVSVGEEYSRSTTHIVAPPGLKTIKTSIGCVSGIWLVPPEWAEACIQAQLFVDETDFGGTRNTTNPFKGKSVHLTEDYKKDNANKGFNEPQLKLLIEKVRRCVHSPLTRSLAKVM